MMALMLAAVASFGSVAFAQSTKTSPSANVPARRSTESRDEKREAGRGEKQENKNEEARERRRRHHRKHRHVVKKSSMNSSTPTKR